MKYNVKSHITTIDEVKILFDYLVNERNCNFHPDDDFAEYVYNVDGTNMFTKEEISLFNRLMNECFTVCEKNNESVYNLGLEVLKNRILKDL